MLLDNQIQIFEEFLRDYKSGLTGSFIAKKKKLNQKTVANYLNKLEKETILKSKIQGKNKLYFLNLDNQEIVKNFIMAVEHMRAINFYKKHMLVRGVLEKINKYVDGIAIIFGSYAKNTKKKDSDLDILIIGKCNEKEIDNISNIYKIDINLKIYPKLEQDILTKEVIRDHVIIKNTEKFIRDIING
jgi:predicted nucleotidyltransferase